jgi:hypothetical protein
MKNKTKSLYLALTLLALNMLALSLLAPFCSGAKQKWKTYENKEWGFKVKYPADWNIQVLPGESLLLFDALNIGYDPDLVFQVICSQPPSKKTPYELTIESVELFKKDFPDYTYLEITNITLDGFPTVKIVDTFTDATKSPPLHTKAIWIASARKGISYSISFMVNTQDAKKTAENFDKYLPLANEMIDSFKRALQNL